MRPVLSRPSASPQPVGGPSRRSPLFLKLSAPGLSHTINNARMLPIPQRSFGRARFTAIALVRLACSNSDKPAPSPICTPFTASIPMRSCAPQGRCLWGSPDTHRTGQDIPSHRAATPFTGAMATARDSLRSSTIPACPSSDSFERVSESLEDEALMPDRCLLLSSSDSAERFAAKRFLDLVADELRKYVFQANAG